MPSRLNDPWVRIAKWFWRLRPAWSSLRSHRAAQAQERLLLGYDNELDLLYSRPRLGRRSIPRTCGAASRLLLSKCGLPRRRFHASYLLAQDMPARSCWTA